MTQVQSHPPNPSPTRKLTRKLSRRSSLSLAQAESFHKLSSKALWSWRNVSNIALYISAGLSMIDLLFDIAMVQEYYDADQPKFATATLVTIALNLFLQLVVVLTQNGKRGANVILRESLFVVTFVKPGVDVFRVVVEQEQAVNSILPPINEMLIDKGVERFAECIPGAVIQTMAFVNGQHSDLALLSLASSILTAGFISASMTIEKGERRQRGARQRAGKTY
ncbi:hypothetical protein TrLO_g14082 [Triparma laevis f. longispina]|uniref:Uncharacterized protein n=1 Tax=Triparma laevis f. longispina TaxID=1714387 RepID=A0A9W7CBT3_9STRA|nr:hypothetical protein TrLO_g14082 [Triparma laevis f. longispina]